MVCGLYEICQLVCLFIRKALSSHSIINFLIIRSNGNDFESWCKKLFAFVKMQETAATEILSFVR